MTALTSCAFFPITNLPFSLYSAKRLGHYWTKAEKAELLKTGKVKGYEGHHINNVKDHPEFAGNPNNIEFVKRPEHLDAHGGNFRNETHGELLNRNPNKD